MVYAKQVRYHYLSANWLAHKIDPSLKYYIEERMIESHMSVYLMS